MFCVIGLFEIIFGFTTTVLGLVLSAVFAVLASIIIGVLVYFVIWIAIGIIGMTVGTIIAVLIYTLVLAKYSWADYWSPIVLILIGLISSMILACQYQMQMILFATSLLGAKFFMQGVIYLLETERMPGFIDQIVLFIVYQEPINIVFSGNYWVFVCYLVIYGGLTVLFLVW